MKCLHFTVKFAPSACRKLGPCLCIERLKQVFLYCVCIAFGVERDVATSRPFFLLIVDRLLRCFHVCLFSNICSYSFSTLQEA